MNRLELGKVYSYMRDHVRLGMFSRRVNGDLQNRKKIIKMLYCGNIFLVIKRFEETEKFLESYMILSDDIIGYIFGIDLMDVKEII